MSDYPPRPPAAVCEEAVRAIEQRAARADRAKFREVMARIGREEPGEGDEIPPGP